MLCVCFSNFDLHIEVLRDFEWSIISKKILILIFRQGSKVKMRNCVYIKFPNNIRVNLFFG